MKASCEALCRNEGLDGCCFLENDEGCYWLPGGHAYEDDGSYDYIVDSISIDCSQGIYLRKIIIQTLNTSFLIAVREYPVLSHTFIF